MNEFVDGLLSEGAHQKPSDNGHVADLQHKMRLPEWFDEEKYDNGRRFFWKYCFGFGQSMTLGLATVFAVHSVLKVLMGTRRSNSTYTSYNRYRSTMMHVMAWLQYELKPGTLSWRSLHAVRGRHVRAGKAAVAKGQGIVSQRDMALTMMGLVGFAVLKPDKFSIRQNKSGDWEGFVHFWRTVGYMLGVEDRYNICRKNIDETREVCRMIQERVFAPCLENVPEYYEHVARAMLEGQSILNAHIETSSSLFWIRYLADVPGYIYTEADRIAFQKKLRENQDGQSDDKGVDTAKLTYKSAIEGLPDLPPRFLHVKEFDTIETTPAYKQLNFVARYRLALNSIEMAFYNTELGRFILNLMYRWDNFIDYYFPFKAFLRFGIRKAYVNMFEEDPKDETKPRLNAEFTKPTTSDTWYGKLFSILW
ncbi:uncharacterized protein [Epargyreus clarus]|uniref:uncharacterized protein isoform X2 n=1 Tax=Epargyreus clarus TaxID=520877 RepID=UPI003C2E5622